MFSGLSNTN